MTTAEVSMPTYSYACRACQHAFDIRQSFTDDSLTFCPECGEPRLRKVIHPVGIAFKGSGFYKTDSRAADKAASNGASRPGGGSKEPSATGSESKGSDSTGSDSTGSESKSAESKGSSSTGAAGSSSSKGTGAGASSTSS